MRNPETSAPNDPSMAYPRVNILGVGVHAINLSQTIEVIHAWIEAQRSRYICVTPAHSIMDCQQSPQLMRVFNTSGLTVPDGMSLVWLLQWMGYRYVDRVYGADILLELSRQSVERGYTHFFYGGAPGVGERIASRLTARYPGLDVAGSLSPPYRQLAAGEEEEIVRQINRARPDVVWVGLGSPRQERWMADHVHDIPSAVLIGIGAAFDYLSGRKRQAPRWVQRAGMEWFFRLITEPRRLWRRYAQYPRFGLLVAAQLLGLTRYENESLAEAERLQGTEKRKEVSL